MRQLPALFSLLGSSFLASSLPAATIRGRITECFDSAGVSGYVVKAFEELTIGFADGVKPCTIQTQAPRLVGTTTTAADGTYRTTFTPSEDDPEFCHFEAKVFVRVFLPDGTTPAINSLKKRSGSTVVFDLDVCPEPCPLTVDGPPVISGAAGATATFDVTVLMGSTPNGIFNGEAITLDFELAAIGASILNASAVGTAVEQADSVRFHIDPHNPFDPPECPREPVLTSVLAMDFEGVVGLPMGNGPQSVLRVTLSAVFPPLGESRAATIYFPLDCQHVGTDCFYRNSPGAAHSSFPISHVRELDIILQGVEVSTPRFRRADINASGLVDISDAVATFSYLFLGGSSPGCMDAADSNGDGVVDISDGVNTLSFLFEGGRSIPDPGPTTCGLGRRELPDCTSYDGC